MISPGSGNKSRESNKELIISLLDEEYGQVSTNPEELKHSEESSKQSDSSTLKEFLPGECDENIAHPEPEINQDDLFDQIRENPRPSPHKKMMSHEQEVIEVMSPEEHWEEEDQREEEFDNQDF